MGRGFRRDDASLRGANSRQLALASQPQPLLGFELRHPQEMAEDVEPMTPGQLDQFGNGLRNEGHGLVGAALLASFNGTFLGWRVPTFA